MFLKDKNILILIIISIFLGPNIEIFKLNMYFFIVLAIYFLLLFKIKYYKFKFPQIIIFPLPFFIIPLIFKLFLNHVISQDVWFVIRYLNLYFLFYVTCLLIYTWKTEEIIHFLNNDLKKTIIIVLFFISIIAIFQFFKIDNSFMKAIRYVYEVSIKDYKGEDISSFDYEYGGNRVMSIYSSPLFFSTIMMYLLIIYLSIIKQYKTNDIVLLLIFLFSFLISNSRASSIAFIISIITMFFLKYKFKIKWFAIIAFSVFLFVFIQFLPSELFQRYNEIFNLSSVNEFENIQTLGARIDDMKAVFEIITSKDYFLYGIPLYEWTNNLPGFSTGNQWFTWFQFYGIWGIGIFVWYIYFPVYFYKKYTKCSHPELKNLFLMLFILLLAGNISSVSQVSALLQRWREFLFILLAFVFILEHKIYNIEDVHTGQT